MNINEIAHWGHSKEVHKKDTQGNKKKGLVNNDRLEISKKARDLHSNKTLYVKAKNSIKETNGVRDDKIEEVREKIKEGFYFQGNVSNKIVSSIMEIFGIK